MAAPTICPMRLLLLMCEAGAERLLGDDDVLDVAEELEAPIPAFAADAAALDAAERGGEIADAEAVDPDEAGAHALGDGGGVRGFAVAHATQAIVGAVGERRRL